LEPVIAPLVTLALLTLGLRHRAVLWISVFPALLAVAAILFLVRETPDRTPSPHPFLASLRGLPKTFTHFLYGVGLFGAGDFAHSLMILYAVTALTARFGAARAATISVGLYALHNIVYAGISYPIGVLADRMNKRVLLAFAYATGASTALLLALNLNRLTALAAVFVLGGAYVGMEETLEDSLAAELLPDVLRGTGFGTMAVVNGVGDLGMSSVGFNGAPSEVEKLREAIRSLNDALRTIEGSKSCIDVMNFGLAQDNLKSAAWHVSEARKAIAFVGISKNQKASR
jgi:hypothetical protein